MNQIILKGMIRNIEHSHDIGNISFDKAELLVPKMNGSEDVIPLRFKKFANKYTENQQIELMGNLRTYSEKLDDGHNKVHLYVFTYFDIPPTDENDKEIINQFHIDGRICKLDTLRENKDGKQNIHFILANNIITEKSQQKLNTYIPMVAFGNAAKEVSKMCVGTQVMITGRLNSREYKKMLSDGDMEIRVAYEGIAAEVQRLE